MGEGKDVSVPGPSLASSRLCLVLKLPFVLFRLGNLFQDQLANVFSRLQEQWSWPDLVHLQLQLAVSSCLDCRCSQVD